ncbi:hypothetical protein GCM10025866_33490 [Naasia aerilata]|uniref:DUF1905 domain-containing protein n=2 Tax=Naasia aerilata TaxID=1162966 RepID=A0ABM8GGG1_9MICO|nr:hypothetical protein GCM10025866_33490 [Naasia aerilata]
MDLSYTERLTGDMGPHRWTVVILPGSAEALGTGKPVRVAGTIDTHGFEATLLPLGEGRHMLPLNAKLKKAVGKSPGDEVVVRLDRRLG